MSQILLMLDRAEHCTMKSKWGFKILSDSQSTHQIKQIIFTDFKLDWSQTDPAHWVEGSWSELRNPKSLKSKLCLASDKTESRAEAEFNRDPCDSHLQLPTSLACYSWIGSIYAVNKKLSSLPLHPSSQIMQYFQTQPAILNEKKCCRLISALVEHGGQFRSAQNDAPAEKPCFSALTKGWPQPVISKQTLPFFGVYMYVGTTHH